MKIKKKVKATRLARKMYPDAPIKDGYMLVEVNVNLNNYKSAEKLEMANMLLNFGVIKTPEDYLNVVLGKKELFND